MKILVDASIRASYPQEAHELIEALESENHEVDEDFIEAIIEQAADRQVKDYEVIIFCSPEEVEGDLLTDFDIMVADTWLEAHLIRIVNLGSEMFTHSVYEPESSFYPAGETRVNYEFGEAMLDAVDEIVQEMN